jgi:hypothetical protein
VSLVIVELRAAKALKREQKACWIFYQKTPTIIGGRPIFYLEWLLEALSK